MPIFTSGDDAASHCNIRAQWEYGHKQFKDVISMNTSLVDRLLSLIVDPYKAEFTLKRNSDPNMNFKLMFQTFLNHFGATTEHDRGENKNRMKAP